MQSATESTPRAFCLLGNTFLLLGVALQGGARLKEDLFSKWEGDKWKLPDCLAGFVKGEREDGTLLYKAVACGKEWCEDCGKEDSWIHLRRVARWTGKAFAWIHDKEPVGYLVVTFPPQFWQAMRSKDALRVARHFWRRKLKREGHEYGLCAWHTHGDCPDCKNQPGRVEFCRLCGSDGNGRPGTGAGREYKPHLNFLFSRDKVPKEQLREWRKEWVRWLNMWANKNGLPMRANQSVLHYQFARAGAPDQVGKVWHWVKYITRPTHRIKDADLAFKLKGFHLRSTWGKWKRKAIGEPWLSQIFEKLTPKEIHKDEKELRRKLLLLAQKICPYTGQKIKWEGFKREIPIVVYRITQGIQQYIQGGYFYVRE